MMSQEISFHPRGQYLDSHQSRAEEPGDYENLLGDALERAFAAGVTEIDGVVDELINYGVPAPQGQQWNMELLAAELKRLAV